MRNYVPNEKETEIAKHIVAIMELLEIPPTEDNNDTPNRIAKMLNREVFKNVKFNYGELMGEMTTFKAPVVESCTVNHPIVIRGIKFTSMCSHHWLPFTGYVDITYTPNETILGLSKFPRVVKYFSKRPNIQEQFTNDIGEFLVNLLNPKSITVTVRDVRHSCVEARGVEAECEVDTTYEYREDKKYEA